MNATGYGRFLFAPPPARAGAHLVDHVLRDPAFVEQELGDLIPIENDKEGGSATRQTIRKKAGYKPALLFIAPRSWSMRRIISCRSASRS